MTRASGLAARLREAAPNGIDAFIDLFGPDYVQLAVDLGVAPERIDTIIAFQKAGEVGAKTDYAGASDPSWWGDQPGLQPVLCGVWWTDGGSTANPRKPFRRRSRG